MIFYPKATNFYPVFGRDAYIQLAEISEQMIWNQTKTLINLSYQGNKFTQKKCFWGNKKLKDNTNWSRNHHYTIIWWM